MSVGLIMVSIDRELKLSNKLFNIILNKKSGLSDFKFLFYVSWRVAAS